MLPGLHRRKYCLSRKDRIGSGGLIQCLSLQRKSAASTGVHPRTSQKLIFEQLCNEPCFVRAQMDIKAKASLKKRLQRGRKFLLLAKALGIDVLYAVPEVSVTRLDAIRLE